MPLHLARAMADLEEEHRRAGATAWTRDRVMGLIAPYPRTGNLDSYEAGQDDEGEPPVEVAGWESQGGMVWAGVGPVSGGTAPGLFAHVVSAGVCLGAGSGFYFQFLARGRKHARFCAQTLLA